MSFIEVENLRKDFLIQVRTPGLTGAVKSLFSRNYTTKTAVDNVSFKIDKGEILGYIGPNGAGKSTTIKMLVGILVPTSGKILVNGLIPHENRIENAKKIGIVFGQKTQLWWDIPVIESLNLMRYMYNIEDARFTDNLNYLRDLLDLREFENTPVRQLSLGQKMRADLCASLLHKPDILLLDEPTIGLDVVVKERIREFIRQVNKDKNVTVILTTHDMSDIEKLCSRVMVIDHGSIVYDGNLDLLKSRYGDEETLIFEVVGLKAPDCSFLLEAGAVSVKNQENKVTVTYRRSDMNKAHIIKQMMDNLDIRDIVIRETEIDEVIRRLYNDKGDIVTGKGADFNESLSGNHA